MFCAINNEKSENMSKCRFILVRHGQSEGNLVRSFLGHTDLDITELGHKQAECTAEYLKDEKIDVIYSSDLKRAWNTAEHIAAKKNLSIIADSELREIFAGEWENRLFCDLETEFTEDFKIWREDIGNARPTGGESVKELSDRIIGELIRIAGMYDGETVCIATHATPIRMAGVKAMGLSVESAKNVNWAPNASVTVIDVENGDFKLIKYGYNEHMGELSTFLPKNV